MMTTTETLNSLKGKDAEKAFRQLYRCYPRVSSLLRKMGGTRSQAEDIFQEGLMVLYRKANEPGFAFSQTPEAYLLTTCKYLWLKQQKQDGRNTTLTEEEVPEDFIDPTEEENRQKALKALKKIGQKCQDLLISFYVLKSSMKEISQRFGYSSDKVAKNQKYKCLEYARNLYRSTH